MRDAALVNGIHMPIFSLSSESQLQLQQEGSEGFGYLDLLKSNEVRRVMIPLCSVWFLFGLTYYGLILFVVIMFQNNNNEKDEKDNEQCLFDYSALFLNSKLSILFSFYFILFYFNIKYGYRPVN